MKSRQIYARASQTVYDYWQEIARRTGETPSEILRRLIIEEHAKLSQETREHDHRTDEPTSGRNRRGSRIYVDKSQGEKED